MEERRRICPEDGGAASMKPPSQQGPPARPVFCEPLSDRGKPVGRGSIGGSKCVFDAYRDAQIGNRHSKKILFDSNF